MARAGPQTAVRAGLRAAAAVLVLFDIMCCVRAERRPIFETPEWAGDLKYGVGIGLRRERADGGALLIKHDESAVVRRYSAGAERLEIVGADVWERAGGAVARCGEQFHPDAALLGTDPNTGRLRDARGEVPAAGGAILNLTAAPRGDKVAVLSATGSKPGSILPFGGGAGASGQYWHQVWSIRERRFNGPAVRIPTPRSHDSLRACWPADEGAVVYYEVTFSYLLVVEVD